MRLDLWAHLPYLLSFFPAHVRLVGHAGSRARKSSRLGIFALRCVALHCIPVLVPKSLGLTGSEVFDVALVFGKEGLVREAGGSLPRLADLDGSITTSTDWIPNTNIPHIYWPLGIFSSFADHLAKGT